MVQNTAKPRGRPRAYKPEEALTKALETFWKAGYSGTSLDDLSVAMGMNKPSIYAGFGDKKALYLKAVELYRALSRASVEAALAASPTLCEGLKRIGRAAVANYVAGDFGPRGCFMIGTAVTEAASDPDVKSVLELGFRELEDVLAGHFRKAAAAGEPLLPAPPEVLARMASDVIYGLALRARAGAKREELEASADAGMALICGERVEAPAAA
jgi:TetR/AcrR family transcriptional regulator, copper-responsive repressor